MMLEVEELNDFLAEIKEDNLIRVAELQTALQDDKGEPMIGMVIVLTSKVEDHIVKYVATIGTAYPKNEKDIQDLVAKKDKTRQEIKKAIEEKSIGFTSGMWSSG